MEREIVIRELEECSSRGGWSHCPECTYKGTSPILICRGHIEAILVLLKEQEPVKPILKREGKSKRYNDYVCPVCDEIVVYEQNFCSECGKPLNWD